MKLFLLILLSVLPFLASLIYFLPTDPPPYAIGLMGLTKAFLFFAPFLLWSTIGVPGSWRNFPKLLWPKNIGRQILIGLGIGALMSGAVLGCFVLLSEETRAEALRRIALKITVLKVKENFWIYGLVLSIIHSLLEEFYWRFFIFSGWKGRLPQLAAHLVAGLAFGLHHFTVTVHYFDFAFGMVLGLGVCGAGMIWTFIFEKERSLLGVWISHIVVDLAIISIGLKALAL